MKSLCHSGNDLCQGSAHDTIVQLLVKIGKYEQGEVLNTVTKYLVREKNIQTKNIYTKNKTHIIVNLYTLKV